MSAIRTDLHNAEEALTISEVEFRDKLAEQTKLKNLVQKVRTLDEQITDRQEAALKTQNS